MFTRRRFLQGTTATLVGVAGLPRLVLAEGSGGTGIPGRSLVVIQLAGGNDGLNTVVPYRDPLYPTLRPKVALDEDELLPLDEQVALHGSLAKIKALFDLGNVAIIRGVGYPKPNRSHFESTAIWQTARVEPHREPTGWLGRALDADPPALKRPIGALGIGGGGLTPSLYARSPIPSLGSLEAFTVQPDKRFPGDAPALKAALAAVYQQAAAAGGPAGLIRQVGRTALASSDALSAAVSSYQSTVDYPRGGFGDQLRLISQLLAADLGIRVFHLTLAGFDTHANQKGAHANLLTQLSDGVHALLEDIRGHGLSERVAVMTYSEFGRRVHENGSAGTDHGAASVLFLLGEPVHGGQYGPPPQLSRLEGGDLPFAVDFRTVYASVLKDWLGLPAEKLLGLQSPSMKLFRA